MTVVPSQSSLIPIELAVPLPRYAKLVGYAECAFFGISHPNNAQYACREIWTKSQRDMVEKYLAEAQLEIEQVIEAPVVPRWIEAEEHPAIQNPVSLDWSKFIVAGFKTTDDISLGESVDHTSDPAVIGPVATTVTDENEIHVFHPGSDVEIHPSKITLSGGNVTIEIPRCRLVSEAYADNPVNGWDYYNIPPSMTSPFLVEVDIKRVYNDPSTNVILKHPGTAGSCTCGCSETETTGCIIIKDSEISSVYYRHAVYSNNVWTKSSTICGCGAIRALYYYKAGFQGLLSYQLEDAIMRLAHSKMPNEPCGCDVITQLWRRDRDHPEYMTRERMNCAFGLNNGAWIAFQFAMANKIWKMSNFMGRQNG